MTIKNDEIYPLYICYLEQKKLKPGELELSKISESRFIEFKKRYDINPDFKKKIDNIFKSEVRDIKLEEILDNSVSTSDIDELFNF